MVPLIWPRYQPRTTVLTLSPSAWLGRRSFGTGLQSWGWHRLKPSVGGVLTFSPSLVAGGDHRSFVSRGLSLVGWGILVCFPRGGAMFSAFFSRCFSRLLVPLGGVARMLSLFPHLMLLHMVSDGFHLGGEEGFMPWIFFCVSSFLGATTFKGSGGLLSVPYESYPSGEG